MPVARIDKTPFEAEITGMTHDGRGVARRLSGDPGDVGKAVFIAGALPGERVMAVQTGRHRSFDEARTVEVLHAAPERVEPRCAHFGVCGGCAMQHYAEDKQILAKQQVLLENLERIGHVRPERVLAPLTDAAWGYRRKGRFSVRRVEKKDKTLVGFRESDPRFVADIAQCHTVIPQIGLRLDALAALVDAMDARSDIPQIEFIAGDPTADFDGVALVFRHMQPLSQGDRDKLVAFGRAHAFANVLVAGLVLAPLVFDAADTRFRGWLEDTFVFGETLLLTHGKLDARRIRRWVRILAETAESPEMVDRLDELFARVKKLRT